MSEISEEARQLFQCLLDGKERTGNFEVRIDLPSNIHKDKRKELATELTQAGYIKKINYYGRRGLYCHITTKEMKA